MPLRVVIDSSVLRAGFVSRSGASRVLLNQAFKRRIEAVASTALMVEYADVLLRPVTLKAAGMSGREAERFLAAFCGVCKPVPIDIRWRPQTPDQGDELVLEAAINGRAAVIVTFDLRHLEAAARRFGICALRPATVLDLLP
jgi:putative PIN family toxin of toxin-antitoxin system